MSRKVEWIVKILCDFGVSILFKDKINEKLLVYVDILNPTVVG